MKIIDKILDLTLGNVARLSGWLTERALTANPKWLPPLEDQQGLTDAQEAKARAEQSLVDATERSAETHRLVTEACDLLNEQSELLRAETRRLIEERSGVRKDAVQPGGSSQGTAGREDRPDAAPLEQA